MVNRFIRLSIIGVCTGCGGVPGHTLITPCATGFRGSSQHKNQMWVGDGVIGEAGGLLRPDSIVCLSQQLSSQVRQVTISSTFFYQFCNVKTYLIGYTLNGLFSGPKTKNKCVTINYCYAPKVVCSIQEEMLLHGLGLSVLLPATKGCKFIAILRYAWIICTFSSRLV